jgi:Dolichyl-phosphate-mannose-protein mannosyltransferase
VKRAGWWVVAGAFLLALPTLAYPIGWDQAVYGLAGRALLQHGWRYRQFLFDTKSPAIHALFALVYALAGNSMIALRLVDILILSAGAFLLFRLLEEWIPRPAASLGAVLYVFVSAYRDAFWSRLQPETVTEPLIFLALYLAARAAKQGRPRRAFAAGALIGMVVAFKVTMAFVIFPAALLLLGARRSDRIRMLATASAGGAASLGAFLLVCTPDHLLADFFRAQIDFVRFMYADRPPGITGLRAALEWIQSVPGWPLALLAAAGLGGIIRSPLNRALTVWAAAGAASVAAQGHYHVYHFSVLIPPLSGLAAASFHQAWRRGNLARTGQLLTRRVPGLAAQYLGLAALGLGIASGLPALWRAGGALLRPSSRESFAVDLWVNHTPMNLTGTAVDETFKAARLLRRETGSQDRVFVSDGPLILFLADRQPCDPYVFNQYWIYRIIDRARKPPMAVLEMRDRIVSDLLECRPRLALFVDRSTYRYPAVARFLNRDYRRLHGYVRLWVFERRDWPPQAPPAGAGS